MVAWISEGIAEWVQIRYDDQAFTGPPVNAIREAVAQGYFADRPPTRDELYERPEFGYPISASFFEWLAETSGKMTAFEVASFNLQRGVDELFFFLDYPAGRDARADWSAGVRDL